MHGYRPSEQTKVHTISYHIAQLLKYELGWGTHQTDQEEEEEAASVQRKGSIDCVHTVQLMIHRLLA